MLLPSGAVEDLLSELHSQQAADEAQQTDQMQVSNEESHGLQSSMDQHASSAHDEAEHAEQLSKFEDRLRTSVGKGPAKKAGAGRQAYHRPPAA